MAELNLKQITDKLNSEFTGEVRKLVFWYDANAEFKDDIETMELENAKILHLEPDNQFYIKYFLECEDTENHYLIYAPFAKPAIRDNHLADTILYSKEFHADRASLLTIDLGIDERYKGIIQRYIKFFGNKDRTQKFYDLEIESFNRSTIELALMSVICKTKTSSFEEVIRCMLTEDGLIDNKYLAEFEKYDLLEAFWNQAENAFGFSDPKPTLEKLIITMFVSYASRYIGQDMPQAWKPFVSYKTNNIIAFIDNLMNSYLYGGRFDEISDIVYNAINGKKYLAEFDIDAITDCSIFAGIDEILIKWLIEKLKLEDVGAKLNGKSIPAICAERRKKHFGNRYKNEYFVIENAFYIISNGSYQPQSGIDNIIKVYTEQTYKVDTHYRYFYYHYDSIEDVTKFEKLRELVENIYTNDYLNKITVNWNTEFTEVQGKTRLHSQTDFFSCNVRSNKERTVVIISDALRYDVAKTLFEKLSYDEKCTADISVMQGVLPSYTALGMAALLPHKTIEYNENFDVLVDGKPNALTEQKEVILKEYKPNSKCVWFDAIRNMKRDELRGIFTGQDVVYIFHNQIDARGDKLNTENEVFTACEEAIDEIHNLMRRISSQANTHRFIITADHGFIYKRDKLSESDKISGSMLSSGKYGQRYAVSENPLEASGVLSLPLICTNNKDMFVSYPLGTDIFKVPGSGQNFVHGGSSPQELIIPVIDVKFERGAKETTTAQISLVSLTNKITNLITTLDFIQTEPISEVVKETTYRIFFVSEDNEKISNENIYVADKKDTDATKRVFRLKFSFKNKQYNKSHKYYLVAYDDKNDIEVLRYEIVMDIAFADDFGF